MPTLTATRGLPASGKSRRAKQLAAATGAVLAGRDSIRIMLTGSLTNWHHRYQHADEATRRAAEDLVTTIQTATVRGALAAGVDVIVDDCNLNLDYLDRLAKLAGECWSAFELLDFTAVSLDVCLARNAKRRGGERVPGWRIHEMYRKYLSPQPCR